MDARGWNAYDLEAVTALLGHKVSQPTIHRILTGAISDTRSSTVKKLASGLGIPEVQLVGGERCTSPPDVNAELLGEIGQTGRRGFDEIELPFIKEEEVVDENNKTINVIKIDVTRLRFSKHTLRRHGVDPRNALAAKQIGNSMFPVLPDGSVVAVDRGSTKIVDGKMFVFDHNGHLRIKVLYKLPDGAVRVHSYNSTEFTDEHYKGEEAEAIKVIGRVFWYSALV